MQLQCKDKDRYEEIIHHANQKIKKLFILDLSVDNIIQGMPSMPADPFNWQDRKGRSGVREEAADGDWAEGGVERGIGLRMALNSIWG
jgi:hypothetical protein